MLQAYLYISSKKVLGLVVVEQIKRAFQLAAGGGQSCCSSWLAVSYMLHVMYHYCSIVDNLTSNVRDVSCALHMCLGGLCVDRRPCRAAPRAS